MSHLLCDLCGHPIPQGLVEWVNVEGEHKPFHTGDRHDPEVCANIARHSKQYRGHEFYVTRMKQDEFMR